MRKSRTLTRVLGIVVLLSLTAAFVFAAEDQQRPQRPERGQRGEGGMQPGEGGPRGGFDRQAMQQRMMERMQEQMGTTDAEWKIIEPRLSKVMELSQSAGGRGMMMFRGMRGGRRGSDREETQAEGPVEKATQDLQTTLENETASAEEIKSKLQALRSAREKTRQELAKAQQDLREVLSVKQEAQLVMMGMLE